MAAALTPISRPVVVLVEDPEQGAKVYQFVNEEGAAAFEESARAGGAASLLRLMAPPPESARTLYEIEEHLAALADCTESATPEQEQAFLGDFQAALTTAEDKRDRMAQFLVHCESQAALADQEIKRLQARKAFYERTVARIEGYITMVIVSLGSDAKGKWKKLEGKTVTFAVQRNPPSTVISDETAVPLDYKSTTVTLPSRLWERLVDSLDFELGAEVLEAVKRATHAVDKTAIKAAIEAAVPDCKDLLKERQSVFHESVPGAAIAAGALRLVRR